MYSKRAIAFTQNKLKSQLGNNQPTLVQQKSDRFYNFRENYNIFVSAKTMTTIDVDIYNDLQKVSDFLKDEIGFGIEPIPDFLKDCPLISAEYTQDNGGYKLECKLKFILAEEEEEENLDKYLEATLTVEITENTPTYTGELIYPLKEDKTLSFELQFQKDLTGTKTSSILVATTAITETISLKLFEGALPGLENIIPEEITIGSNYNAIIVMTKSGTKTARKFLLGLGFKTELNLNIDLSELPLIGDQIPFDPNSNYLEIRLLVSTKIFDEKELTTINELLSELKSPVEIQSPSTCQQLTKGASIAAKLELIGIYKQSWFIPLVVKHRTGGTGEIITITENTNDIETLITITGNSAWFTVQKSFGPIYIGKIGLLYLKGGIRLVIQTSLQISRFVLSLIGLSVRADLCNFDCDFKLEGFGLQLRSKTLQISGAFARLEKEDYDEYLGIASLGIKIQKMGLSFSTLGSFADFKGEPALFLYLAVSYPLGGAPFFFVTGLSGGFGYSRSLTIPELEELPTFPLVYQAVNGVGAIDFDNPSSCINEQLELLDEYIQPSLGSGFFAAGMKFTSFKLVDSFALLTAAINEHKFELNLIGNSRLVVPPKVPKLAPIAQAEMILRAQFALQDGLIAVQSQLTAASYIFSTECHLTGGFAFFFWFAGKHAGDFVITLGGYHPDFDIPPHYPQVPRLGYEWQIDKNTFITGQSYFALCSHALMAGGLLALSYDDGWASASFTVGADFLICWKPYYYDIKAYVSMRAKISFVSGNLGVQVHFWGPEFGGTFKIDLVLFSVQVKFGDQSSRAPLPIDWDEFRESFLPPDEEMCSITATEGLIKQFQEGDEEIWILNPTRFGLVTDAFIPSQKVFVRADDKATSPAFGINSMGIKSDLLETKHHVQIEKNASGNWSPCDNNFTCEPVAKKAPTAMWGEPNLNAQGRLKLPEVNGQQFVEDVLFGFQIFPAEKSDPVSTQDIEIAKLQYETTKFEPSYLWEKLPAFGESGDNDAERRNKIRATVANNTNRNLILEALGFDLEMVRVDAAIADAFVFAPLVK
ncbi:hypothetical protein IQ276_025730 [Desmonostoc muscorum LEGE 12446]|uniref:Transcriptional regulator n=1 Tax=Desmonostoc muscorum LEGE 12446 TaxID=1828758 RepID=A0A8J7CZ06_DESMC|nr:DUF6603 domain-containing protein [Desmonostoc muscorum]MCF2149767.1 hypothetical protein [Desmonostoc muscorum LEGE 12446]